MRQAATQGSNGDLGADRLKNISEILGLNLKQMSELSEQIETREP